MKCDCQEALLHHATRLREARARLLEDAESTDVFVAIEQAGKFVCANTEARLRKSANRINELLEAGGCHGTAHAVLTDRVRKARNARMHEGIVGRASGRRAWELALRLETAFRKKATEMTGLKAKDVMERDVITAKSWQTLYEVRREMLINAVSVLPWKDGDTWRMVTAKAVVKWLRDDETSLDTTVCKAAAKEKPRKARTCTMDEDARKVRIKTTLVMDDQKNLRGILTAEDLLETTAD